MSNGDRLVDLRLFNHKSWKLQVFKPLHRAHFTPNKKSEKGWT